MVTVSLADLISGDELLIDLKSGGDRSWDAAVAVLLHLLPSLRSIFLGVRPPADIDNSLWERVPELIQCKSFLNRLRSISSH